MSQRGMESKHVKTEPLHTDDRTYVESDSGRRQTNCTHQDIKKEPKWNIESCLPARVCINKVVNKEPKCETSEQAGNIDYAMKEQRQQGSKAGTQLCWHMDHMVKVERDVLDVSNVSDSNESYNTPLMQSTETNYIKMAEGDACTSRESEAAMPTGLYIDHVVKVERETDYSTNKVNKHNIQYRQHESKEYESKAEQANYLVKLPDNNGAITQSGYDTEQMVKDKSTSTRLPGLYMDHVMKEELVVGPEVLQRPSPHQASPNRVQNNNFSMSCFVSLESMHVDREHGVCVIGLKTYKFTLRSQTLQDDSQKEINGSTQQNQKKETKLTNVKRLRHQISNLQEKPYKCKFCNFATAVKQRLSVHKKIHFDDKPFKCGLCSYASSYKAHLQIHERTHKGKKPFKCDKCSYTCVQQSDLSVHQRVHSGEKPFKCGHCDYACNRKRDLLTHIRTHTGEKPFKCDRCDYGCIRKRDFVVHTSTHHTAECQEDGEKIYKCDYCSYTSPSKHSWLLHNKMHSSEKPYKCNRCNYAVTCKTSFLNHIQKHAGETFSVEKRFKCSHCNYATNHKNHMAVHQIKHTGEKPHKCRHCCYATGHRRDLLVHEALHKGEKPFKCGKCSYACGSVSNLRNHERLHIGEYAKS